MTLRLADALPQTLVVQWKQERDKLAVTAISEGRELSKSEEEKIQQLFSDRIEKYLDAGAGKCWMNNPDIADLVENALKHFDKERYGLLSWYVMPNHVHAILQPYSRHELSDIQHSWKSYTAHEANRLLNRAGIFWQPESYDHLIRDEKDLEHSIEYVLANPKAAGLENWRWVGVNPNIATILKCATGDRGTGVPPFSTEERP